jgi:serine-type D-Ala-D-Ala carboxypeptidase (penicillin-binding protein 5/6)
VLKALLSFLIASTLHATPMADGDFAHKAAWQREPLLSVQPIPVTSEEITIPELSAGSALAIDLTSGIILYEKNTETQRPIASLTKLMTALIIAEEELPGSVVTISENAASIEGSTLWLNTGEEITVKDLMYGMMIASGNDAAMALAEYNAGSMENFVRKMNQKAEQLGLKNTNYANPMGFDSGYNYSTARDLGLLSMYSLQNEFLMEPVDLVEYEIESKSGITHEYLSTNKLLDKDLGLEGVEVHGLKTGRTPDAGECLITVSTFPDDQQIMTVVLGSEDRFGDTESLIDWIYESTTW